MNRERPILMSALMVRAILEGRKTQTRRIIKPQPTDWTTPDGPGMSAMWPAVNMRGLCAAKKCPYGIPGDRLWVRESYCFAQFTEAWGIDDWQVRCHYYADSEHRLIPQCDAPADVGFWPGARIRQYKGQKRPAIFMPRWASRITLEITEIRVQRLQDITEEDAEAEGADRARVIPSSESPQRYRNGFRFLWEEIHNKESWQTNPWVWAISFRKVTSHE